MSRTKWVPLKIVYGPDISAGTPFLSFTEYLQQYDFVFVDQNGFEKHAPKTFAALVSSLRRISLIDGKRVEVIDGLGERGKLWSVKAGEHIFSGVQL